LGRVARVVCIEPENRAFSPLEALCRSHGVPYHLMTERHALSGFLQSVTVPTLVVSAYNAFLFPESVLEKDNLAVVNFHNSLLPRHRGRNAPTWTIYEMDRLTGVTWHQIGDRIDTGTILWQETIDVPQDITAIALTLQTLEAGATAFCKLLPSLLEGVHPDCPLPAEQSESFHRSTDLPNGGVLDLGWCPAKAYAFLRAMDYGKLDTLPLPRVRLLGDEMVVKSYRFLKRDAGEERDALVLSYDGKWLVWNQLNTQLSVECEQNHQISNFRT
jgi:methionyl-tRNA formyltransferase